VRFEAPVSFFVVNFGVLLDMFVGFVYRDVLVSGELVTVWLQPGLVEDAETWYKSFKSQEFAFSVEPVSTIGDWSWVIELDGVLVGSSVEDEVVAGSASVELVVLS